MRSATATPGVRSSSTCTRSGWIAMRAVCRYSSRRCADTPALRAIEVAAPIRSAVPLLARELGAIVVGRVAINRMDVIDAVLRRVFDDQRRPLNAEVRRAAVRRRSAPGEISVRKVGPNLGHPRL